jgi:hypothetical protein
MRKSMNPFYFDSFYSIINGQTNAANNRNTKSFQIVALSLSYFFVMEWIHLRINKQARRSWGEFSSRTRMKMEIHSSTVRISLLHPMGVCATESSCSASEHLPGSQRVISVVHVAASPDVKLSASHPVPPGAKLGRRVRFKFRSRYPLSDTVHVRSWRHTSGCRFRVKGYVCGTLSPSRNLGRNLFPRGVFLQCAKSAGSMAQWESKATCSSPTAGAIRRCPVKPSTPLGPDQVNLLLFFAFRSVQYRFLDERQCCVNKSIFISA